MTRDYADEIRKIIAFMETREDNKIGIKPAETLKMIVNISAVCYFIFRRGVTVVNFVLLGPLAAACVVSGGMYCCFELLLLPSV